MPAIVAAEYLLYQCISDQLRDCLEGDDSWIDGATDIIESDSPARRHVATALRDLSFTVALTEKERLRLDRLLEHCAPYELNYDWGNLDHDQRVDLITTLVQRRVAYQAAT